MLSAFSQALLSFLSFFFFENLVHHLFLFLECLLKSDIFGNLVFTPHLQTPEAKESVNGEKAPGYMAAAVADIKIHLPGHFLRMKQGLCASVDCPELGGVGLCSCLWFIFPSHQRCNESCPHLTSSSCSDTYNFTWGGRIFHFFLLLCYVFVNNSFLSSVLKVSLLLLNCSFLGLCVYGVCECGCSVHVVCTQLCTHEEARRSVLLYHSLLYSLRQGLLLRLGLQPVDGGSPPFATLPVQLAFHISAGGSHSGSQACLATALTTELSPPAPATVLAEVHFPITT